MVLMVDGLPQGINRTKWLVLPGQVPVLSQLVLVLLRPFGYQPLGSAGHPSGDQLEVVDVERGLVVAVGSVEVWTALVLGLVEVLQITIP